MSDKIDIQKIKNSVDIVDVIGRYIDLKKNGPEYQACCPFHDERTPSFTVSPNKGFFHCFGCGAHGDVIDFVSQYTGCEFKEAAETLGYKKLNGSEPVKLKSTRVDPYEKYKPIPFTGGITAGYPAVLINPKRGGKEWKIDVKAVYPYGDQGFVLRTEVGGKKITPMVRMCSGPQGERWTLYPFDDPRPIYGNLQPNGQVMIVEGEKSRDHLQAVAGDKLSVLSWAGGTNGVDKTDWDILAGRNIILWPDNDEPGFKTMRWLKNHLESMGCSVRCVIPEIDRPKGWDGADEHWADAAELFQWCKSHIGELPGPEITADEVSQRVEQHAESMGDQIYNSVAEDLVNGMPPKDPPNDPPPPPEPPSSDLDQAIEKLSQDHSVVLNGDKLVIARKMLDEDGKPETRFLSTQSFHAYHANNQVFVSDGDNIKPVSVSQAWMKDKRRPTYDGVTFDPTGRAPKQYMNLWQGFAVEPSPDGSWGLLKNHIKDNVCGGNPDHFGYVITWMAQMFQEPAKKPGVMLVFRGKKGVGKSIVSDNLQRILGNHAVKISRAEHLTGKFNAHMANRLLVAVEEGFWAGDKSADGPLKDLITSDSVLIEKKGFDPIKVRNCLRMIMTTNNDWVVPATKGDRRYAVFDVSDTEMQNRKYFNPITKQMNNGGLERMLYDLLHWDISEYSLNDIPETEALTRQKQESFDSVEGWWFDVLESGSLGKDDHREIHYWPDEKYRIARETVHEIYCCYCQKMGMRHPRSKRAMLETLRNMCPSIVDGVREKEGARRWAMQFPSLNLSRSEFDGYTGQSNHWVLDEDSL